MTPFEKYPLIHEVLLTCKNDMPTFFDLRKDPDYTASTEEIEANIKTLKYWLSDDCAAKPTPDEVSALLLELENNYCDADNYGDDYAFFSGFAVCAELLAEISAIRKAVQYKR